MCKLLPAGLGIAPTVVASLNTGLGPDLEGALHARLPMTGDAAVAAGGQQAVGASRGDIDVLDVVVPGTAPIPPV